MATIFMIFLRINCSNLIGLVWRRHTKFQIAIWCLPYRFWRHWLAFWQFWKELK